ncbi:hypothetical protein LPJ73_000075 [Coemansia sp. RSA 2703]|nr:hypothetical protein LPJ73_000075 [Coemansia sp. RSA 2703]KAJ2379600.1 hypothetical protein IW150_000050 [Coemansia sp. RSA 2607]
MVEYATHIWKAQPTRLFVPLFFLNGDQMSLLIFARGNYYRIELGKFFRTKTSPSIMDIDLVKNTLTVMWYLIRQPPHRFGHAADVTNNFDYLTFGGTKKKATMETIDLREFSRIVTSDNNEIADTASPNDRDSRIAISIEKTIDKPVQIFGRLGYVFRVKYGNRRAILKLMWTPADGVSESFTYDVLRYAGVKHIPEVFSSGILVKDFCGYRFEYILLEDCGDNLMTLAKEYSNKMHRRTFHSIIANSIRCTLETICQAQKYGIFHCDISTGNITVKNGQMCVIDWGYAKLTNSNSKFVDENRDKLVENWGQDVYTAAYDNPVHDALTGTR